MAIANRHLSLNAVERHHRNGAEWGEEILNEGCPLEVRDGALDIRHPLQAAGSAIARTLARFLPSPFGGPPLLLSTAPCSLLLST